MAQSYYDEPLDASKIAFMLTHGNYYYNVMPFGLKNIGATYQWLMNAVFATRQGEIWRSMLTT